MGPGASIPESAMHFSIIFYQATQKMQTCPRGNTDTRVHCGNIYDNKKVKGQIHTVVYLHGVLMGNKG